MCLITTQMNPLIASNDIVVYKLLRYDMYAEFSSFKYELGKLNETTLKDDESDWDEYGRPRYCAFDTEDLDYFNYHFGNWRKGNPNLKYIGQGFHSAKTIERLGAYNTERIYRCVIPKGSEYYENPTGLMVSNKIIIVCPI